MPLYDMMTDETRSSDLTLVQILPSPEFMLTGTREQEFLAFGEKRRDGESRLGLEST